jgi:hypothetical protein
VSGAYGSSVTHHKNGNTSTALQFLIDYCREYGIVLVTCIAHPCRTGFFLVAYENRKALVKKKSSISMACFKFGIGVPYSESNHLTLFMAAENYFPGLPRLPLFLPQMILK